MKYLALATDFDGTLAHDGKVSEPTLRALRRLRNSGRMLLMVTGRQLDDLLAIFKHIDLFDCIVAENGALLFHPATKECQIIAPEPPTALLTALRAKNLPISVGRSIVATVEPHEHAMLDAIRDLGLEWHVIFNKGAVMALPAGITKTTGLIPALKSLAITPAQTVAIGDAENDHAFMRQCGLAVAVANALPSVKADADWTTTGASGKGVAELIDRLIETDLAEIVAREKVHENTAVAIND